jgi:ribonucleoside-diphosphate reductase alpha chain
MLDYNIKNSGVRFEMVMANERALRALPYDFGFSESKFGEIVYHRTYSRIMEDGSQETWPDTVVRVINGVFTIRKWWILSHNLPWDEVAAQERAYWMAVRMLRMLWLPPGRGLWVMGTDYLYERGSMGLYNCAFVEVRDLPKDISWLMDALMCGCGVGFGITPKEYPNEIVFPGEDLQNYVIPDTREGWVESVRLLLDSYQEGRKFVTFDYSQVRPYGLPIKGFGGLSSGPEPLMELHDRIRDFMESYIKGDINWTRLVADLANATGACVVAGNVRRSAEICMSSPGDQVFIDLKDYDKYPERQPWGWISNNSVRFRSKNEFLKLDEIAERINKNGEPGVYNALNVQRYARYGDESYGEDRATGINPCGEIPLESYEVCNLSEVFPTRCSSRREFLEAVEDASFYSSTVSLYPTHSPETNAVIARNRRIGVSLSGIAEWIDTWGSARIIKWIRDGYKRVREVNESANAEAGVPPSLRVTTVKPSGTISQLTGVPSGMHYPTFSYAIRRMILNRSNPIFEILKEAGYLWEPCVEFRHPKDSEGMERMREYDHMAKGFQHQAFANKHSIVVSIPLHIGRARPAQEVSAWEQFTLLAMLQREWADNSVSCTVYFDRETEGHQVASMLSAYVPIIKSVSMLPHTEEGVYPQMPYQKITKEVYEAMVSRLSSIDWSQLTGSDGNVGSELYCSGDQCEIGG